MNKLVDKAIKLFAPFETYQVINVNNIDRYCPQLDALIHNISHEDTKKITSFLLPHFPLETQIEILTNEKIEKIKISELSEHSRPDAIFVKAKVDKNYFEELVSIISTLRSPDGCPWDLEQTLDTIKGHLIEEAYEVVDTINRKDYDHLKEELGDLMLQIILYAQMAGQSKYFTLEEVLIDINDKLIRRHPHVFGQGKAKKPSEVVTEWEKIKKKEKDKKSYMEGIPLGLPSLGYAQKIQTKASRVGFDWLEAEDVLEKLEEEVEEFKKAKELSREEQEDELGDILFSIVNYGRKLEIDSESALLKANKKFMRRFKEMENIAEGKGRDFAELTLEEKEQLWKYVKDKESK